MNDEKIPGGSFSHIQGAFLFCMSNCPLINPEIKTGKKWHYWDTQTPGTAGQSRKSFFNVQGVGFHKAICNLLFNLPFAHKNSLSMYFLVIKVYIGNSLCFGTEACWHIQFPLQQVLRFPLNWINMLNLVGLNSDSNDPRMNLLCCLSLYRIPSSPWRYWPFLFFYVLPSSWVVQ